MRGRTKSGDGDRHGGHEPGRRRSSRGPELTAARDPGIEEVLPGVAPETGLERAVTSTPELREGLAWGRPRAGHPEGPVGAHVSHLLDAIDRDASIDATRRTEPRFLALVHDAFKNRVQEW